MRNISDTIRRLRAGKYAMPPGGLGHGPDRLADLPAFGSNPGMLRARAYIPNGLPAAAPLVVVLHGCTQTAAAYDHGSGWSHLADRHGFALLFAEQQRSNNANLCFNWFVEDDIKRDSGEALSIRQMIEAIVVDHRLDRRRIFITGLSAGGAMASVMLAAYPEIFAGGTIVAGLPYRCALTIPEAFDRMRGHGMPSESQLASLVRAASDHDGPWPTISVWQGTADHTVHPSNAAAIVAQWRALHGIDDKPTLTQSVSGYPRQVWHDAQGREAIDFYSITGMGHGTPIATGGSGGDGTSGPFMLDVGLSSTFHIARSWKLTAEGGGRRGIDARQTLADEPAGSGTARSRPAPSALATTSTAAEKTATPRGSGIARIIEDALRSAGLMPK
jgi:poly(hydroxyalkanoate) depolymerase family esterase